MPPFALTRRALDSWRDERRGFHTALRACFTRQAPRDHVCNSMVGQCRPRARQSIEPLALQVAGGKGRARPRLVREARWDAAARRETSQHWVQAELGEAEGVRIIAETGCAKPGQASVGGARQEGGSLGQVEPCQVGVFAAEASR